MLESEIRDRTGELRVWLQKEIAGITAQRKPIYGYRARGDHSVG